MKRCSIPKPEHGSLEWLKVRHRDDEGRVRFGASEAPILAGVSKWKTIADLAIEKWAEPEVQEGNAAMQRGQILEPALVSYAEMLLGEPVITPDEMFFLGRFIATLDGLSHSGVIVECKTTTAYSSDDPLPEEYYWQVQAQFACLPDCTDAIVVVLDKHMRLGAWRVQRNDHDLGYLFARAEVVGSALDRRELPPDAQITEKNAKALWPNAEGSVELDAAGIEAVGAWQAAKIAREHWEAEEQTARDRLVAILADKEFGTVDGIPVVSYKTRKGSNTVDWKAVARDHGDLLDQYRKVGAPTRVLKSINEK